MDSLAVALELFDRGFMPVPVKPRDKRPIHDDWQNRRYQRDELPKAFIDGENVGMLLGEASDNTVDLDIDHPLGARAVTALRTPKTLAYHRSGRPHLLVRCEPLPKTTKFMGYRNGKAIMFAEVRANGCQSVAPGSVHPEGDAYEWLNDEPRAAWDDHDALNFARDVSTVCLLADHWKAPARGESGVRHQMALAAAGFLGRRTDDQTVAEIIEAAASIAGDAELLDRRRAVEDTLRKLRGGIAVVGFPTLIEIIGQDDARTLEKWWPDLSPVLVAPPSKQQVVTAVESAFDDEPAEEAWQWKVYDAWDFLRLDLPKIEWLIGGFIHEMAIVINFGPPGAFKTITGAQLCVSVALGSPFLGEFPTKRGRVLIVQEDTLDSTFQGYLRAIVGGMDIEPAQLKDWLFVAPAADMRLDRPERVKALADWLEQYRPSLVMLDAFYLFHDGEGMTAKDLNPVLRVLKSLRRRYECAFWVLDHDRKTGKEGAGEGNPIDRLYGGRPKSASADAIVESSPVKGDKTTAYLTVIKLRGARPPDPIRLRLEEGLLVTDGGSVESASGSVQAVYQWLLSEGGSRTKRQMGAGTKLAMRSLETALGELTVRGLVRETPRSGREKTWIGLRAPDETRKGFTLEP